MASTATHSQDVYLISADLYGDDELTYKTSFGIVAVPSPSLPSAATAPAAAWILTGAEAGTPRLTAALLRGSDSAWTCVDDSGTMTRAMAVAARTSKLRVLVVFMAKRLLPIIIAK